MNHQRSLRRIALLIFCVLPLAGCRATRVEPTPAPTSIPATVKLASPAPDVYERFDLGEDLYLRQIQKGVYIITHEFPWAANSMVVEMADSTLVLVDTPYTPEATKAALDWIQERLGRRRVVAINTGFHHDNLGGNSYLIEVGIPIYGSDLTAELLEERGDQMRAQTLDWLKKPEYARYYGVHEALPYVPPNHLFPIEEGLELQFGDEAVQVYYPGPSHSPDNVVVYFPRKKILFGGCMIIGWDDVGNTTDADLEAWPNSVSKLSRFDFDVLVPGHGQRLDPGLLEHTIELLTQ